MANSAAAPLTWNGLTIPQYGWAAHGPHLKAYTAQCGSSLCDYAQTPASYFANARNQTDLEAGSGYAAPSVSTVQTRIGNRFVITYRWQVYRSLDSRVDYVAFVHFVDDSQVTPTDSGIVFGDDHGPSPTTLLWAPGQTLSDGPWTVSIPSSVPDGRYSIRVGLYDPATGARLLLSGNDDGTERYIVGYLAITGSGSQVSFVPPPPTANDPRLNSTGAVLDFDAIQTDGAVSITQNSGMWILRPYPRYRSFTVRLNTANFPEPSSVEGVGETNSTAMPVTSGMFWSLPLNGARYYTWPVN